MRISKWLLYIAALAALAALAFPISAASAKPKEQALVFVIDPSLSQPKPPEVPKIEIKEVPVSKPQNKVATSTKTSGFNHCNCVSYVQYKTGGHAATGIGIARNHPVNTQLCTVGAIIVTYESRLGHVGIVAGCDDQNVTIDDYNYVHCGHAIRNLSLTSSLIKGYYIWNMPSPPPQ